MCMANGYNVMPNRTPAEYVARLNKPDQQTYVATKGEVVLIPEIPLGYHAVKPPLCSNKRRGLLIFHDNQVHCHEDKGQKNV